MTFPQINTQTPSQLTTYPPHTDMSGSNHQTTVITAVAEEALRSPFRPITDSPTNSPSTSPLPPPPKLVRCPCAFLSESSDSSRSPSPTSSDPSVSLEDLGEPSSLKPLPLMFENLEVHDKNSAEESTTRKIQHLQSKRIRENSSSSSTPAAPLERPIPKKRPKNLAVAAEAAESDSD